MRYYNNEKNENLPLTKAKFIYIQMHWVNFTLDSSGSKFQKLKRNSKKQIQKAKHGIYHSMASLAKKKTLGMGLSAAKKLHISISIISYIIIFTVAYISW